MEQISTADIRARLQRDNPWWSSAAPTAESKLPKRVYYTAFKKLALNYGVKRAAILLGPRRVGKTVMLKQIVHEAVTEGLSADHVFYASIDTPLYSNISLESFLGFLPAAKSGERCLVVFDEIQYLKDWQVHLKDLVDSYPNVKFIASGSAAAALSLQSKESGAGRFSDFMLPPLTFCEFLEFSGREDLAYVDGDQPFTDDIAALNAAFIEYLNYGGYPEAVFNQAVRDNPEQFIRIDIVEKVLLKDLPSLYGIDDIQELNKLFMFLAYNAGNEASYAKISQTSGLTKATIRKYVEYLESAFLILKLPVVNDTCKSMQRERNFKIYLNNPSMRSALFSPVGQKDDALIGHLAESAVFSQWQHAVSSKQLRYARWRNAGEIDIVYLSAGNMKPLWIGELKWSDRYGAKPDTELRNLKYILDRHRTIKNAVFTTRTITDTATLSGRPLLVWPTSLYCYLVGRNTTSDLSMWYKFGHLREDEEDEVDEAAE
jgi:predicted AAA+ superfamily ATPase